MSLINTQVQPFKTEAFVNRGGKGEFITVSELAEILTSEHGKVLSDALGEVARARYPGADPESAFAALIAKQTLGGGR